MSNDGEQRRSIIVDYEAEMVWGLTLEFLLHLIDVCGLGEIPFQWQVPDQPTWFQRSLL